MNTKFRREAVVAALALLAAAPVLRADQPIVIGKRIPVAMSLDLTCTGDMAPRRQKLMQFLAEHKFTAVDLHEHPLDYFSNSDVASIDKGQRIVGMIWKDPDSSGKVFISFSAPQRDTRANRRFAEALEKMVRRSFDCQVEKFPHSDYEMSAEQYAEWARSQEEAIRSVSSP